MAYLPADRYAYFACNSDGTLSYGEECADDACGDCEIAGSNVAQGSCYVAGGFVHTVSCNAAMSMVNVSIYESATSCDTDVSGMSPDQVHVHASGLCEVEEHHHHGDETDDSGSDVSTDDAFEWAGLFELAVGDYTWLAQKVDGSYADPTMTIAFVPTTGNTTDAIDAVSSSAALVAMATDSCTSVSAGTTLTASASGCYKLVFDDTSDDSMWTLTIASAGPVAIFCQHYPTECVARAAVIKFSRPL
jgi:hypothetical protein